MANFFDRVVYEVNKGVSSVTESSKELLEKSRLNGAINECKEQKLKIAQEIGVKIYNMYMTGAEVPDAVKTDCDGITQKINEIKAHKRRLDEIRAQEQGEQNTAKKVCECGFENAPDSNFCQKCGKKLN